MYERFLNGCSLGLPSLSGGEHRWHGLISGAGELSQGPQSYPEDTSAVKMQKTEKMPQASVSHEHIRGAPGPARKNRNTPDLSWPASAGKRGAREAGPGWSFFSSSPGGFDLNPHCSSKPPGKLLKRNAENQLNKNLCEGERRHLTLFSKNPLVDSEVEGSSELLI